MDNITLFTMEQLKAAGFSHPDYEHFLNFGMVYWHQGSEYCIGGGWNGDFTDRDREAAAEGQWLPDADQLLQWLESTDFTVHITLEDEHFSVHAVDNRNGTIYTGGGYPLCNALAKTIRKICKSQRRDYTPRSSQRFPIIDEL